MIWFDATTLLPLLLVCECAAGLGFHEPFSQKLGGVTYEFMKVRETSSVGTYSQMMVTACRAKGMRPVIDATGPDGEAFAGTGDERGLKIEGREITNGAGGSIMKKSERDDFDKYPAGWAMVKDHFAMLCGYRANQNGGQALCDTGTSTAWRTLTSSGHPGESWHGAHLPQAHAPSLWPAPTSPAPPLSDGTDFLAPPRRHRVHVRACRRIRGATRYCEQLHRP